MNSLQNLEIDLYKKVLDRLRDYAFPIEINKDLHIEERQLMKFIYTSLEYILRMGFDPKDKKTLQRQTNSCIEYLKSLGIHRKDNIYYGIGKISDEEMERRFGPVHNPNPGSTIIASRYNRRKQ